MHHRIHRNHQAAPHPAHPGAPNPQAPVEASALFPARAESGAVRLEGDQVRLAHRVRRSGLALEQRVLKRLDQDQDGRVSAAEASQGIARLLKRLGTALKGLLDKLAPPAPAHAPMPVTPPVSGPVPAPTPAPAPAPAPAPVDAPAPPPQAPTAPSQGPAQPPAPPKPGRDGIMVPMYIYPSDLDNNPAYNALIAAAKKYDDVPVYAILNPNNGPGDQFNPDYQKAIDKLKAAGVHVMGYVASGYGDVSQPEMRRRVDQWSQLYQGVDGIFVDEMQNTGTEASLSHYKALNDYAHAQGYEKVIANPGTSAPDSYFERGAADVIVTHETDQYPTRSSLAPQDAFSDQRALLVHSQRLDPAQIDMMKQHSEMLYVTDDTMANPWDTLPGYLDGLFAAVSERH